MTEYAGVYIIDIPFHADKIYDYYIPAEMDIAAGDTVSVAFGNSNRKMAAVVWEIKSESEAREPRPVEKISKNVPRLSRSMLDMCVFLKEHTLCTFGDAVKTVLPVAGRLSSQVYYSCADGDCDESQLADKALIVYSYIKARGRVPLSRLKTQFGSESGELLSSLAKLGAVKKEVKIRDASSGQTTQRVSLAADEKTIADILSGRSDVRLRSETQKAVLTLLSGEKSMTRDELCEAVGANCTVQLAALEKKGLVKIIAETRWRNPYESAGGEAKRVVLSPEQSAAFDSICKLYEENKPRAALLYGVTGSGKTSVIKAMIDRVLADGRSVIVLVPEISLTPQTVGIFCSYYKDRVAVIHSGLSQGERYDAWRRANEGLADVIIGTRSAVFAPVKKLGLIVIDEEQEHTYKSDTNPKYLTHDAASFRCAQSGALMLLSSATPSVTSYYKAKSGAYSLVTLDKRYGEAVLPRAVISDMRAEGHMGNTSPIGSVLYDSLVRTLNDKKQAIIFLNRRGYNSTVTCRSCGEPIICPNCSVSLTYHTRKPLIGDTDSEQYLKTRQESGSLTCHYCGYTMRVPDKCPKCSKEHFRFTGCGTQRVEEELHRLLPKARVLRMDMDTTSTKFAYDEILSGFRRGEADILLGTQMVTKGHDFENVTLVGVMNADSSLYLDDYRAGERTFSMLTQVIGRAGRAKAPGIAVIQTMNPKSDVITSAMRQNYREFYEREIRLRKNLVFPPFCDMAVFTLSSTDEALLAASAVRLSERMRELLKAEFSDVPAVVFGPFEAPVYKIQNMCRMRMVVKCRLNRRTREMVSALLCEFGKNSKRLIVSADLNPTSL